MRKTLGVCLLLLLLTGTASAGIMPNGAPEPPPQPAPAVQGPTTNDEMNTPLTTDGDMPNGASDGIIQNEAVATFLQVVLNLLAVS